MIQDLGTSCLNSTYIKDAVPQDGSAVIFYRNGKILLKREGNSITFPEYGQVSCRESTYIYLFSLDGRSFFLCDAQEETVPEGFAFETPQVFRATEPKEAAFALVTARHICAWYDAERYCGRCGSVMKHSADERMMECPECGNRVYPVISPAVIVAVTDGDRILLTRYASREGAPSALVAGFCEVGETVEQTVAREVMEETGLRIKDIRYYKSQPWGITGGILMGFWCRLDGSDEVRLNDGELGEAVWRTRDEIPGDHPGADISLTGEMIQVFGKGFEPYG